ncbi:hypothetical protein QTP88_006793 [Uroleucon formosanum]
MHTSITNLIILKRINNHTHDSNAAKVEANIAVCNFKKRARETMEPASTVINECISGLSEASKDNCVRRANRNRRGRRTALFPPHIWNLHLPVLNGQDRTNNHAEAANRRLNVEMGVQHPSLWSFINCLRRVQAGRDVFYSQLEADDDENGGNRERTGSVVNCSRGQWASVLGWVLDQCLQVLSVLFFNLRKVNLNLHDSAALVIRETCIFWDKARIPTRDFQHCSKKLKLIYEEWRKLQKNSTRKTATQKKNENNFLEKLEELFDIAHLNALDIIKIDEDRQFLLLQRQPGRPGHMSGVDYKLSKKEDGALNKLEELQKKRKRADDEFMLKNQRIELQSSSDSENEELQSNNEIHYKNKEPLSISSGPKIRASREFITTKLAAALDKCKITDREAVHLLISTVEALGLDVNDFIINRSSIHRYRERFRSEFNKELRKSFSQPLTAAVVHWDGKILPALTGNEYVDRLPVLITNNNSEYLLGVPKLESATGKEQAQAIFHALQDWGIKDSVKAICCDTTASNTGRLNGACVLLEQLLEKDLLYLPCRHHISEVILKSVFDVKFGSTSDLEPQLWDTDENYKIGFHMVQQLKVVNDTAERSIKLIEDYNSIITKNEDQKQFLLQVVRNYRQKYPDTEKKFTITQHISRDKHLRALNTKKEKEDNEKTQMFLNTTTNSSFNSELCYMMLLANIPISKLKHPDVRNFLFKHIGKIIPDESTIRKYYVSNCYNDTINNIRAYLKDKKLWISIDETTDVEGRFVANVIIGSLELGCPGKTFLFNTELLEKTNNSTIMKLFDKTMCLLYPEVVKHDNILLFVSDAAPYMVKAGKNIKALYLKMEHVTCLAHGLYTVAEEMRRYFSKVDALISNVKKIFVKCSSRVLKFKEIAPEVPMPPQPILTRWGTWLMAPIYYCEHYQFIKSVVMEFDKDDAVAIENAQTLLADNSLEFDLAFIKANYDNLPKNITTLETFG